MHKDWLCSQCGEWHSDHGMDSQMSEMVERVAMAIERASQPPGQKDYKILMENCARAAIEAMREPTEEMLSAGDSMMPQIANGEDITTGYDALRDAWPAMITAALTPRETSS